MPLDLSVLLVTHNSRRDVAACLTSLPAALAGLTTETVVIDNHSTDGTREAIAGGFPAVRTIALDTNVGFAAAINAGLAATTGRFVLWLNPDSRFIDGRVADVIDWMRAHEGVGIVGGRILDPSGSIQRSARAFPSYGAVLGARYSLLTKFVPNNPFSRHYLRSDSAYDAVEPVDWVSGAFLLHTRALASQIGGPDPGYFMYFEDVDFCYRAWQAGRQVYFHPGMTIEHAIGGSSRQQPVAMLIARHHSLWRWYATRFPRFWLKDAAIWTGVWLRCAMLIVAGAGRRRAGHD